MKVVEEANRVTVWVFRFTALFAERSGPASGSTCGLPMRAIAFRIIGVAGDDAAAGKQRRARSGRETQVQADVLKARTFWTS